MRVPRWLLALAGSLLLLTGPSQAWAENKPLFRAGAHAQDITPPALPISVNGGMRDRQATAVHDRLHARCLVLDDGTTRLAIVVCDSCMIPREIFEEAKALASKATGIPTSNMLMSATHTHTAPTVAGVFQSDPDEKYVKYLPGQIARGIEEASKRLQPARIGWAVGKDPSQVFNRRWRMKPGTIAADPFGQLTDQVKMNPGYRNPGLVEPAGTTDPDVSIVAVQSREGRPLALLANYSLHYVGGVSPLSADYFGAFAEKIADLVGAREGDPPFVGIMSNGTSGDINNINFAAEAPERTAPYEKCRIVADSVARAAFEAYKGVKYHDHVSLAAAEKDIDLGVRLPDEKDLERAREILEQAKQAGKKELTTLPEIYARESVLLASYPRTVKVKLQALRIGELGICAIPCEVFVQIGLELKKKSPLQPTFTIELANGYNGYLPTPEQHKLGGYETWRARSSYLEPQASTRITSTLLELLDQVAKK